MKWPYAGIREILLSLIDNSHDAGPEMLVIAKFDLEANREAESCPDMIEVVIARDELQRHERLHLTQIDLHPFRAICGRFDLAVVTELGGQRMDLQFAGRNLLI